LPRNDALAAISELNSLADALLPAPTPVAERRGAGASAAGGPEGGAPRFAPDGTPLRERLARAWNGKSYYDRLVEAAGAPGSPAANALRRAGGGAGGGRNGPPSPPPSRATQGSHGHPLVPRVAGLAKPPLASARGGGAAPAAAAAVSAVAAPPPSPSRAAAVSVAAAGRARDAAVRRARDAEAALALERASSAARLEALEAEVAALRQQQQRAGALAGVGVSSSSADAAALRALSARFQRLRAELEGAQADVERMLAERR